MLISLQVLSGKQPWSEVREDVAVVLRLARGHKPRRPESRTLNDSHWNLIQDCWSAIEDRPVVGVIIATIKQFLSHCPQSLALSDLLSAWSCEADPGAESSSSVSQAPTEGSGTHITQASSDEDDRIRYIVMFISAQSILLTPLRLHLSGSLRFLMNWVWTNPSRARNAACR